MVANVLNSDVFKSEGSKSSTNSFRLDFSSREKLLLNSFIEKLGSIDNTFLFAVSIIPYAIFLFYLYKIKSVNNFVKTGFSLTVLFVLITILVSIFALNYYNKTLVEVDFLHGLAESFLTLSDFVILFGFIRLLNSLEVNNS